MGRFDRVMGTGGIGTGVLWNLEDNRPLERTESRPARLSLARDYCKQHIILHYLARVMTDAEVLAIGKVGGDEAGNRLSTEMRRAGIGMDFVTRMENGVTMSSVCLQYPDMAVCNVTTSNSVCGEVDAAYVRSCLAELGRPMDKRAIVLAAPEVPLSARLALLKAGMEKEAYCVASVLSEEAESFSDNNGFALCNLLVINEGEARALLRCGIQDNALLAMQMQEKLRCDRFGTAVIMTCGEEGNYCVCRDGIEHTPARQVPVISTAGAGDALTAGVLCGLHFGLPLCKEETAGFSAVEMGAAFAERAIQCLHTIDGSIDRDFAEKTMKERTGIP